MSEVVISIYEQEDGEVGLSFKFDPPMPPEGQPLPDTHDVAWRMLSAIQEGITSAKAEDSDEELWND